MITLAAKIPTRKLQTSALIGCVAVITLWILYRGITLNQSLALLSVAAVITLWFYNRVNAAIAALMFFLVKPFIVRVAYWYDYGLHGSGGFDLLGITPALLLAGMIVLYLYPRFMNKSYRLTEKTEIIMAIFCAISFLSIFNPVNSILLGLGGFERNILPNMMVLFLAAAVFKSFDDTARLIKALIILGIVSCIYAIGQYALGAYPWENDWLMNVAFKESFDGWYTIGLRGIELRIFSIFYGYMDFTFANALIFAVVLAMRNSLGNLWRKLAILFMISWSAILILTVERMPIIMSLMAVFVVFTLKGSRDKRKKILTVSAITAGVLIVGLNVGQSFLKSTGAHTFFRLAEMANPLAAGSIGDRAEKKWRPTLETIKAYPLGVGIGYGSQTKANIEASKAGFLVEPHNELLQKTMEAGLLGGIAYLLLLIGAFKDSLRLSRYRGKLGMYGFGIAAGTIGFWLCGLVNLPFSGAPGLLYWLMAGVTLAMLRNNVRLDESQYEKSPENELEIHQMAAV